MNMGAGRVRLAQDTVYTGVNTFVLSACNTWTGTDAYRRLATEFNDVRAAHKLATLTGSPSQLSGPILHAR